MHFSQRLFNSFFAYPIAWLLFALLAVAEYGNYYKGRDLARICELTKPHDVPASTPRTGREEIDNICLSHQPKDNETSE